MPGRVRDAGVWRARIESETIEMIRALRPRWRAWLEPGAREGASFGAWALGVCSRLESEILGREVIWLDLGAVVAAYLAAVLKRPEHILSRLLFHSEVREAVLGSLPRMTVLVGQRKHRGRLRLESFCWEGGAHLTSRWGRLALCPEVIVSGLEQGRFCPGLVVSFAALALCNSFFCLGGVDQWEYMPLLARSFREAGAGGFGGDFIEGGLATGRCVEEGGMEIYPLDMLQGVPWSAASGATLYEFITPQLRRLVHRPFVWEQRAT